MVSLREQGFPLGDQQTWASQAWARKGYQVGILNRVVRVGFLERITSENNKTKLQKDEGLWHMATQAKSSQAEEMANAKQSVPLPGACLVGSWRGRKASVTRTE